MVCRKNFIFSVSFKCGNHLTLSSKMKKTYANAIANNDGNMSEMVVAC